MTFRPDLLLAHEFGTVRQRYVERDAILYALGVGLGEDAADLPFMDERRLAVLPSFAITLGSPGMWMRDPRFGVDFAGLVHTVQDTRFGAPLPPAGEIAATARVARVDDRGPGRGAAMLLEREVRSAAGLHATVRQTLLLRRNGGFGGSAAERTPPIIPATAPDLVATLPLSPRAPLIYRLSGDLNPLHLDPAFARDAGFDRPIMHGLCTYAAAGVAVARALGAAPTAMRRLACRFTGVAFPGETLALSIWRTGAGAAFTARIGDRTILDDGCLELRP